MVDDGISTATRVVGAEGRERPTVGRWCAESDAQTLLPGRPSAAAARKAAMKQ